MLHNNYNLRILMNKSDITIKTIREAVTLKGYNFFEKGNYNLNIIGIRTEDMESNSFNDYLSVTYKERDKWQLKVYEITTDPGIYWRKHPENQLGTAVLVPGQHRSCYQLGRHRNKYEALVQANELPVYRDNNKDSTVDNDGPIDIGWHGINIHRASSKRESTQVDSWSAGCQVFSAPNHFDDFINLCKKSIKLYGPSITYTLIEEKDFNSI